MPQVIGGVERLMREDLKPAQEIRQEISPEIQQAARQDMIQAFLKVRFGKLDQDLFVVADTLSKLIWLQYIQSSPLPPCRQ